MSEDNNYSGKFKISSKNSLMSDLIKSDQEPDQESDQNFENDDSFYPPTEEEEKNYQEEERQREEEERQQREEEERQQREEEEKKLKEYFDSVDPMARQHARQHKNNDQYKNNEGTRMVNGLAIPEKILENASNKQLSQIARASALYQNSDKIEKMARNEQNKNKFNRQFNTAAFMSAIGLTLFYLGSNSPLHQDIWQSAAIALGTCAWKFVSNYMRSKKFERIADNLHIDSQNPDSDRAGMKEWKDCLMNFDFEKADQVAKDNNLYDVALISKEKFDAEAESKVRTQARDVRYQKKKNFDEQRNDAKNNDSKSSQSNEEERKEGKQQPEQGQPEQGQPEQGQPEQGQPEQGQPEQGQPEQNCFDKVISKIQKAKKQGLNKSKEKKNGMGI